MLSIKRTALTEKILRKIPSSNCYTPQIYINRQLAAQYCENPSMYFDYHNTVFMQIYKHFQTESISYNFRYMKPIYKKTEKLKQIN